jgi:hypothetical protein
MVAADRTYQQINEKLASSKQSLLSDCQDLAILQRIQQDIVMNITTINDLYLEPKEWTKDQIFEKMSPRFGRVTEEQFETLREQCTSLLQQVRRHIRSLEAAQRKAFSKARQWGLITVAIMVGSPLVIGIWTYVSS